MKEIKEENIVHDIFQMAYRKDFLWDLLYTLPWYNLTLQIQFFSF